MNKRLLKTLCMMLAFVLIFTSFPAIYANQKVDFRNKDVKDVSDVSVVVNGNNLVFDSPVKISEGRTLVPLRKIAESLGYEVNFIDNENYAAKQIVLLYETMEIYLSVYSSDYVSINDNSVRIRDKVLGIDAIYPMEKAPLIYGARTYVPLRTIAELLSAKIVWDGKTRTVIIDAPKIPDAEKVVLKSKEGEAEVYSYIGQVKDNKPDGVGFMRFGYENASSYKGRWSKGLPDGAGFMNLITGKDNYNIMGEFAGGRLLNGTVMNGRGISYIKNGIVDKSIGHAGAFFWYISKDEELNEDWQKGLIAEIPKLK